MAPRLAPGHSIKLPVGLYARAVMAAELHGRTVGQWVETAVQAQLERDRHTHKVNRFDAVKQEATQKRHASPLPQPRYNPPIPPNIERLNGKIKLRSDVIGIFPNEPPSLG